MDTFEARRGLRALAQEALDLLQDLARGEARETEALRELRSMEEEARSLLQDAGYPGEAAWRAIDVARRLLSEGHAKNYDARENAVQELASAAEILDTLLAAPSARESDFRIVS